ncbi:MAG: GNAT family N-acetyltransferase [Alphaproteobacteria bacterium]
MTDRTTSHPAGRTLPGALRLRIVSPYATPFHEHLARLGERDRRIRLGRTVAAEAIEAYCSRARLTEPLILGAYCDGILVASAELIVLPEERFGFGRTGSIANMLMAIEQGYRRRDLASRLAKETIRHAAVRRIALIRMDYEPTNVPMARLTARLGAVHGWVGGLVRAELCTGWIGDGLVPPLTERRPGFRSLPGF